MISEERLADLWDAYLHMGIDDRLADHLPLLRAVEAEARKQALEEAARVCERTKPEPNVPGTYGLAYSDRDAARVQGHVDCAYAIRALPEEPC